MTTTLHKKEDEGSFSQGHKPINDALSSS
jgi:hypothetical protein